jgi:hypothetical protein
MLHYLSKSKGAITKEYLKSQTWFTFKNFGRNISYDNRQIAIANVSGLKFNVYLNFFKTITDGLSHVIGKPLMFLF